MGNDANPLKLTGSGTTTLNQCFVYGISINTALTGTLIVKENGTAVATFAIGTTPGNYHQHAGGVRYFKLTLVLSAGDDVTIFTKGL